MGDVLAQAKKSISPEKARLMMREGKANGKALSKKQKRLLGAIIGGAAEGATVTQPSSSDLLARGYAEAYH